MTNEHIRQEQPNNSQERIEHVSPSIGHEVAYRFSGIKNTIPYESIHEFLRATLRKHNFGIEDEYSEFGKDSSSSMFLLSESHLALTKVGDYFHYSMYSCRGKEDARETSEDLIEFLNPVIKINHLDRKVPITLEAATKLQSSGNPKVQGNGLSFVMSGIPQEIINDSQLMEMVLTSLPKRPSIKGRISHRFEPQGYTFMDMDSEGLVCLHTYPEYGAAYACLHGFNDGIKVGRWFDHVKNTFNPKGFLYNQSVSISN